MVVMHRSLVAPPFALLLVSCVSRDPAAPQVQSSTSSSAVLEAHSRASGDTDGQGSGPIAPRTKERRWNVYKGETHHLQVSDVPGVILDQNAPPPPNWKPPRHPFLSAVCRNGPVECSQIGRGLRESTSLEGFLAWLTQHGFRVVPLGETESRIF